MKNFSCRIIIGTLLLAFSSLLFSSCNTIGGAGKDISNLGSDISAGANTVSRSFKKDS